MNSESFVERFPCYSTLRKKVAGELFVMVRSNQDLIDIFSRTSIQSFKTWRRSDCMVVKEIGVVAPRHS
jgi:hypothetical protein